MAYTPTVWKDGDVITADLMNHMEQGIESASSGSVAGVSTFNGRSGDVKPKSGDYTAAMVGAATMSEVNSAIQAASLSGVTSFNSRKGDVTPQSGDYTAAMVGAATMAEVNAAIQAIPAGVTSFNSRNGDITPQAGDYTAAMVGARPDTWTPTAADVGAATPAEVTAAIQAAVLDSWEASY